MKNSIRRAAAGDQSARRRDFLQNLAILLLALSAVALFAQTQMYSLGLDGSQFSRLGGEPAAAASAQTVGLTAPVRVAVTGAYGRYGCLTLTTGDEAFADPLGRRLAEALGSAQTYAPCGSGEFLAALKRPSLYYDFLNPLPLPVLSELVGGQAEEAGEETITARRLLIADQGTQGVLLYLWDGASACFRCATAVSPDSLDQVIGRYELGGAAFALDGGAETLAPCSLLLNSLPELPELSAGTPLSDKDWLLSALGFNPRTKTRYVDAHGTEVIMDGDRTLQIRTDSRVSYQGGSTPALIISAAEDSPTLWEAALGAGSLLNRLLSPAAGEAAPYLTRIRQSGSTTVLSFGYQVQGIPVRFPDGRPAAEVTLSGRTVSKLTVFFRQYLAADQNSLLLPARQALAIAEAAPGAELSIGYVDSGGERTAACWLAD